MYHAAPIRRTLILPAAHAVLLVVLRLALTGIDAASAQPSGLSPDTILINGKLAVYEGPPAQALAVRGDTIAAIGSTQAIRALAGTSTRIIDLGGRTVIPGLIDSHIHAIRAGLGYAVEVHWFDVRTLQEALNRVRIAARHASKGAWLVVAGGWTERQFREDRRPTQKEIVAAAPDHRVYIQSFYSKVLLDPLGAKALGIAGNPEWNTRLTAERNADGELTGWLAGDNRAISDLFNRLPKPSAEQKYAGTLAFFRALNARGITGVNDPGGYNLEIDDYQTLLQVWRERRLTLRVRYSLSAPRRGHELEDFKSLTQKLPMGSGDQWLRFNGIGENVTWGFYNNDNPTDDNKQQLHEVLRWTVANGMSATFHWHNGRSVHHLLDVLARVNAETPIARLRWSIAHLNDATPEIIKRMKAMGVGWLVQNAFYFRGEAFLGQRGAEAARQVPPLVSALKLNLPMGGGTDAHRVMTPNPFASLQWMLDGKTISGAATRAPEELLKRIDALRLYTQGSAWFSHDEHRRGRIQVGMLADLALLSDSYLNIPVQRIHTLSSHLTWLGGRVVHAAGPYAELNGSR